MKSLCKPLKIMLAVLLVVLVTSPADAAVPTVLSEMPADAALVVATQPLAQISIKIEKLSHQMGALPPDVPFTVAEALAGSLGLPPAMMDSDRGMGVVIANLADAQNSSVGFLPVKNFQEAIAALDAQPVADVKDVWTTGGGQIYIGSSGGFLLMGGSAELLAALAQKPKGVKLSANDTQLFAKSDVAAVVNLTTVTPMVRGMAMMALMSNAKVQEHPSVMQIINMALDRISELQTLSLGLRMDDAGLHLGINCKTLQGSKFAQFLTNHPPTDLSALAALPAENFTSGAVYSLNPKAFIEPINAILDALAADTTLADKIAPEIIKELKAFTNKSLSLSCTSVACANYIAPAAEGAAPTEEAIMVAPYAKAEDIDVDLKLAQQMCPLWTDILTKLGINIPMTYKPDAGTVAAKTYDQFSLDFSQLEAPAPVMEAIQKQLGGEAAVTFYYCKIDSNRLGMSSGLAGMEKLIKFTNSGQASLDKSPEIAKVAQHLSRKANVIMVADVGRSMQVWAQRPEMQAFAPMLSMLKGTIGLSKVVDNGSVEAKIFISQELFDSAAKVVPMFMGMMMGGQQGQPEQSAPPPTF